MSHFHIFLCISLPLPVTLHVHNFQRLQDHNSQQLFRGDTNPQNITNDLFSYLCIRSSHGRIPEYHIAPASASAALALLERVEAPGRSDLWRMSIMCANGMCKQVSRAEAEAGGN